MGEVAAAVKRAIEVEHAEHAGDSYTFAEMFGKAMFWRAFLLHHFPDSAILLDQAQKTIGFDVIHPMPDKPM